MEANKKVLYQSIDQNNFLPDFLKTLDKAYFSRLYSFIKSQIRWDTTGEIYRNIYIIDIADRLNLLSEKELNVLLTRLKKILNHD
jgi:vacuolar-type H+-ATPase subunit C/Vma6